MAQRQLNLRLDDATWQLLDTGAYLREQTVVDLVRSQIEAFAESLTKESGFQGALRARQENRAAREGTLTPIDVKRSRNRGA